MTDLAVVVGVSTASVAALLNSLARRGLTVATAESLTGGLLAAVLTEVPGSSAVVRGGIVVYATELKHVLAGVDAEQLAARGPVDPEVAAQMADGARRSCGADIGVGLTGVAGPDPQNGIEVGTWFCAIAGPGEHREVRSGAPHAAGSATDGPAVGRPGIARRGEIRAAAVRAALELLANIAATQS